ncbi:uncharacterized protein LOC125658551 isoform X2 [Ostrea edulis]|nr:uncharacterized protein LOC125658551 isoform X2 [Ostrea edulis]XP_048745853.2 uncharacterized protein LOC125658551 isoform X2 [Ostrea edulis]
MEMWNCSDQPQFHLKRIGPTPNRPRVVNIMDFYKVTSMIGRNGLQVDFYIDSDDKIQSQMISRCHARVVRQPNNDHKMFDDSLNGIFVNHIKIRGNITLCEGDRVTFGHPVGRDIPYGTMERQVNNHHQFIFEKCCCGPKYTSKKKSPRKGQFAVPKKPNFRKLANKRERNQTRTFTKADVQTLKKESEAMAAAGPEEDNSLTSTKTEDTETYKATTSRRMEVSGVEQPVEEKACHQSVIMEVSGVERPVEEKACHQSVRMEVSSVEWPVEEKACHQSVRMEVSGVERPVEEKACHQSVRMEVSGVEWPVEEKTCHQSVIMEVSGVERPVEEKACHQSVRMEVSSVEWPVEEKACHQSVRMEVSSVEWPVEEKACHQSVRMEVSGVERPVEEKACDQSVRMEMSSVKQPVEEKACHQSVRREVERPVEEKACHQSVRREVSGIEQPVEEKACHQSVRREVSGIEQPVEEKACHQSSSVRSEDKTHHEASATGEEAVISTAGPQTNDGELTLSSNSVETTLCNADQQPNYKQLVPSNCEGETSPSNGEPHPVDRQSVPLSPNVETSPDRDLELPNVSCLESFQSVARAESLITEIFLKPKNKISAESFAAHRTSSVNTNQHVASTHAELSNVPENFCNLQTEDQENLNVAQICSQTESATDSQTDKLEGVSGMISIETLSKCCSDSPENEVRERIRSCDVSGDSRGSVMNHTQPLCQSASEGSLENNSDIQVVVSEYSGEENNTKITTSSWGEGATPSSENSSERSRFILSDSINYSYDIQETNNEALFHDGDYDDESTEMEDQEVVVEDGNYKESEDAVELERSMCDRLVEDVVQTSEKSVTDRLEEDVIQTSEKSVTDRLEEDVVQTSEKSVTDRLEEDVIQISEKSVTDRLEEDVIQTSEKSVTDRLEEDVIQTSETSVTDRLEEDVIQTSEKSVTDRLEEDVIQISEKSVTDRLEEDVVQTSEKSVTDRLEEDVIQTSEKSVTDRLEDVIQTSEKSVTDRLEEDVIQTSEKSVTDRLEDVIQTSEKSVTDRLEDVIQTSEKSVADSLVEDIQTSDRDLTDKLMEDAQPLENSKTNRLVEDVVQTTEKSKTHRLVEDVQTTEKSMTARFEEDIDQTSGKSVTERLMEDIQTSEKSVTDKLMEDVQLSEKSVTDRLVEDVQTSEKSVTDRLEENVIQTSENSVTDSLVEDVQASGKSVTDRMMEDIQTSERHVTERLVEDIQTSEKSVTVKLTEDIQPSEKSVTDRLEDVIQTQEKSVTDSLVEVVQTSEKSVTDKLTEDVIQTQEKSVTDSLVEDSQTSEKSVTEVVLCNPPQKLTLYQEDKTEEEYEQKALLPGKHDTLVGDKTEAAEEQPDSRKSESGLVTTVSPRKVTRSTFRLTDSVDYTMDEWEEDEEDLNVQGSEQTDEAKEECGGEEEERSGKCRNDLDQDCGVLVAEEVDDENVKKENKADEDITILSGNQIEDMNDEVMNDKECRQSEEIESERGGDKMTVEETRGEKENNTEESSIAEEMINDETPQTKDTDDLSRNAGAGNVSCEDRDVEEAVEEKAEFRLQSSSPHSQQDSCEKPSQIPDFGTQEVSFSKVGSSNGVVNEDEDQAKEKGVEDINRKPMKKLEFQAEDQKFRNQNQSEPVEGNLNVDINETLPAENQSIFLCQGSESEDMVMNERLEEKESNVFDDTLIQKDGLQDIAKEKVLVMDIFENKEEVVDMQKNEIEIMNIQVLDVSKEGGQLSDIQTDEGQIPHIQKDEGQIPHIQKDEQIPDKQKNEGQISDIQKDEEQISDIQRNEGQISDIQEDEQNRDIPMDKFMDAQKNGVQIINIQDIDLQNNDDESQIIQKDIQVEQVEERKADVVHLMDTQKDEVHSEKSNKPVQGMGNIVPPTKNDTEKGVMELNTEVLEDEASSKENAVTESCPISTLSSMSSFSQSDLVYTFDIDPDQLSFSTEEPGSAGNSLEKSLDSHALGNLNNVSEDSLDEVNTKPEREDNDVQTCDTGVDQNDQEFSDIPHQVCLKSEEKQVSEETTEVIPPERNLNVKHNSDGKATVSDMFEDELACSGEDLYFSQTEEAEAFNLAESKNQINTTPETVHSGVSVELLEYSAEELQQNLEKTSRRKRKMGEGNFPSHGESVPGKKRRLSDEELKPVKTIISNYFRIQEYWEKEKDTEKKVRRKNLVGNLVKHFFLTQQSQDSKKQIKAEKSYSTSIKDVEFGEIDVADTICVVDDRDCSTNNESRQSGKSEASEEIVEMLGLSQESTATLTSYQSETFPIYQASIDPGCGIAVEINKPKPAAEKSESQPSTTGCDAQTQANSLEIDLETTNVGGQGHLLDDLSLEQENGDLSQVCMNENNNHNDPLEACMDNKIDRGRSDSTESDASEKSELLLEKVSFPDVGVDDEESCDSSRDETLSEMETDNGKNFFLGKENFQQDNVAPVEEGFEAVNTEGSPRSLQSTSSIDYSAGVVDSSNDVLNHDCEDTEKQADTEETVIDDEIGSVEDVTENQNRKVQSENKNKNEVNGEGQKFEDSVEMSETNSESVTGQLSQSSEFDSEAIEILSTKSTSESELELLYGQSPDQLSKSKSSFSNLDHNDTTQSKKDPVMLKDVIVKVPKLEISQMYQEMLKQQDRSNVEVIREDSSTDTRVHTSFEQDRSNVEGGKENFFITPINDVIKEESSDSNMYIRSRLPKFESDSDVEITGVKTSFPVKSFEDIHITLSESSSDELPEVQFLREEKADPNRSVSYNGFLTIKEETPTPIKTPFVRKALQTLEKTPIKLPEESAPRKVLRKRLSLKRTPAKKQRESKTSPPPQRKNLRSPRKKATLKQTSKRVCNDSDIEIISGSDSEEDFTPSRLKQVKQEAFSGNDSDHDDVRRMNIRGNLPGCGENSIPKSDQKDGLSSQREGEIKRVFPLLEQSSGESQEAGSLSDIFQSEESKDNELIESEAPHNTTEAPHNTTEAPHNTTEAPLSTTKAPHNTTEAPLSTTKAPHNTTEVPLSTTEAPHNTTETKDNEMKEEESENVSGIPERSNTTGTPERSSTTCTPERPSTTGVPERSSTTGTPERSSTTGTPERSSTTGIPERSSTTGTPERSSTTGTQEEFTGTCVEEGGFPEKKGTGHRHQRETADEKKGNVQTANGELNQELVYHEDVHPDVQIKMMEVRDGCCDFDLANDDFVASTSPEDNEWEETWRTVPPLSPDCSQALSPLIPEAGSENVGPETSTELGEGTSKSSSTEKNEKTHKKPSLTMEFDSDSEFSGPEFNFEVLNSPEANIRNKNDIDENVGEDGNVFEMEEDQRTCTDSKDKTNTEGFGGDGVNESEDHVMDDVLPSLSRKRKSQEKNGESKRPRMKEDKIVDKETEEMKICTQATSDCCSTQSEIEDKEEHSPKMSKVRQLMQKLKGKKSAGKSMEESPNLTSSTLTDSQDTPGDVPSTSRVQRRLLPALNMYQSAKAHIQRCKDLLQKLKAEFTQSASLRGNPRISQWQKDLEELETKFALSKTVIAVVGDTGAGKSSLMNALLDQLDILPTSGLRACTAVVVEVVSNMDNHKYEADITFLSKEDWHEELRLLLRDLTDVNGKLKKGAPDPKSEAGVAFLKIKAVYGKIDKFEVLRHHTNVTKWLDRVKTISHSEPAHFRNAIDKYIETADPGIGGQFWPIVKKVTIRLPHCDACSSGAVLVDLPGVRDSNAARDKIARDHLKNCTAVWVISSIHRAIDDKTAKDLLGENFRRQLLMDGQYGNIAFICTKTDDIKNSEIIRGLHLEEKVQPLENEINRLEMEKSELEISKRDNAGCIVQMKRTNRELKKNIEEIEECLRMEDQEAESEELQEIKDVLQEKQDALKKNSEQIEAYRKAVREAENTCLQHEVTIGKKRKELSSLCAKARNDYSKKEIKRDFKAGLREMKKKAGMCDVEEMDDDLYDSDNDDDDIGNSAENLRVFCVSATEYQKMRNIIIDDGPPTVFGTEEDTQIPALRSYIHQMTSVRHQKSLERILQRVAQFVFDIQNYLTEDETVQTKGDQIKSRSAIKQRLQSLLQKFDSMIERLMSDMESALSNQIRPKLGEGITTATARANEQAAKWSASVNKENKQAGGLHWCTYRATVRRQGVFTSPSYGNVNFNQDLTEPMYTSISIVWDKVFSGLLWAYFDKFKAAVLSVLKQFVLDLSQELHVHGIQPSSTQRLLTYILDNAAHQLSEMVAGLKEFVTERQRDANRVLTPIVQENLAPTYNACAAETGPGMYDRMKTGLAAGIDTGRFYMFDDASRALLQALEQIKVDVMTVVQRVCYSLSSTVQLAFEPLWEAPGTCLQLRDQLLPCVRELSQEVSTILEEANVRAPVTEIPATSSASGTDQPSSNTTQGQGQQVTQRIGSSALPQNFVLEEVGLPQVSDLLSSIKSEPSVGQPFTVPAVKQERTAPRIAIQRLMPSTTHPSSLEQLTSAGIYGSTHRGLVSILPSNLSPQAISDNNGGSPHSAASPTRLPIAPKKFIIVGTGTACTIASSTCQPNRIALTMLSSTLPPNKTAFTASSFIPPPNRTAHTESSSILPPNRTARTESSSILPPNRTACTESSSILPPNGTARTGSSSILPPNACQFSSGSSHSQQTASAKSMKHSAFMKKLKSLADKVSSPERQLSASQPVPHCSSTNPHSRGQTPQQNSLAPQARRQGNTLYNLTPQFRGQNSTPYSSSQLTAGRKGVLKTADKKPKK